MSLQTAAALQLILIGGVVAECGAINVNIRRNNYVQISRETKGVVTYKISIHVLVLSIYYIQAFFTI